MRRVAQFVFGLAEDLRIRLGDQDPRHLQRFFLGLATNDLDEALGLGFLFRGECELRHGASPDDQCGSDFPSAIQTDSRVTIFHLLFSCSPRRGRGCTWSWRANRRLRRIGAGCSSDAGPPSVVAGCPDLTSWLWMSRASAELSTLGPGAVPCSLC